ncbi:MAG: type II toxin-antitoxin system RelE/ParE family toxin [Verrucomicrobia bacterium]|nr:type II toxin-antitoxin system RelE/ParE family toxin [Verrucomicrobiota bacterium]
MKRSTSVSGQAEVDLTNQYRWYLDHANAEVAERFLAAFDATIDRLAGMPGIGRLRRFRSPELRGTRSLQIGSGFNSHLVFYRVAGDALSVERIMHGARDLERRLMEPPEGFVEE